MSKLNQIQNKLRELDGGAFQKLAEAYLYKEGYTRINSVGSVTGANKVRTGTPDTFVMLPNGKYVFAEHTTQQSGVHKKFKADLEKCFDEAKTGIPVDEIEEVVLCYNTDLEPAAERALAKECQSRGVNLNLYGMTRISHDLYQKHVGLAQSELGVEIDTGQIVPPSDFVEAYNRSALATPLDTSFHFREVELGQILAAFEARRITVISGRAGVGKSRLALEGVDRFKQNNPEFEVSCILNRGADLFQDLRVHFAEPGNYLIFVDDANRLSGLDYVFQLLHHSPENRNFKVVLTVRDYALDKVVKAAQPYGGAAEIKVESLEDKQIKELIEKTYGILNPLYLDRIADISKGNPRLAVMASQIAKREGTLQSIRNVSALYDEYYSSIRKDLEDLGSQDLLKVAGITAFFRTVDRVNEEVTKAIEDAFGINSTTFWKAATRLHELEVLDMYENEVVKTPDQVLATYLLYLAFFKEKALEFSAVLKRFFPKYYHKFTDAIYPVLDAFDRDVVEAVLRPQVEGMWTELQETGSEDALLHLVRIFWFLNETETLLYARKRVVEMQQETIDPTQLSFKPESNIPSISLLRVLEVFQYSDETNLNIALELILDYAAKRPSDLPKVVHLLSEDLGFKHTSHIYYFFVQRAVVGALWKRTEGGNDELFSRLYLAVAEKYLQIYFYTGELKGGTYTTYNFELAATPEILAFRQEIWSHLAGLYQTPTLQKAVLDVIHTHSTSFHRVSDKKVLAHDADRAVQFFKLNLDSQDYSHCLLAQDYLDVLERHSVSFDEVLRSHFENETYKLSEILLGDRLEMKMLDLDYKAYEQFRKQRLEAYFANYTLNDYKRFFERCLTILAHTSDNRRYQFQMAVTEALILLAARDPKLYVKVLEHYLYIGEPLELVPTFQVIRALIDIQGVESAQTILRRFNHLTKQRWLFGFFGCLSRDEIRVEHVEQLYTLYQSAKPEDLLNDLSYLDRYWELDKSIVSKVVRILLEKAEQEPRYANALTSLFYRYADFSDKLIDIFKDDYDGATFSRILDRDTNFLLEYLGRLYPKKDWFSRYDDHTNFSFIWLRDDHSELMKHVTEFIYTKEKGQYSFRLSYFYMFFVLEGGASVNTVIREKQDRFLLSLIESRFEEKSFMDLVFGVVCEFSPERRVQFIAFFIALDKNFESFKRLSIQSSHWSWTGSQVPALQGRVDYLLSLLPVFHTVEFLEHKQHLEQEIRYLRSDIEREKKRDFSGDDMW